VKNCFNGTLQIASFSGHVVVEVRVGVEKHGIISHVGDPVS